MDILEHKNSLSQIKIQWRGSTIGYTKQKKRISEHEDRSFEKSQIKRKGD